MQLKKYLIISMNLKIKMKLRGRGIFVFSDPGGAKPLLAFIKNITQQLEYYKIISDRKYNFFKDFNLEVSDIENSIQNEFDIIEPNFIFVATSYSSNIELRFILEAKKRKIKSYAFIDHWTSMKDRFYINDKYCFPDQILVIDDKAKKNAIDAGVPKSLISVFGNPYYKFVSEWKPVVRKDIFFLNLGIILQNKKIIIYAPDPLSNVNGKELYGFDEISASLILNEIIKNFKDKAIFLLKNHPNQDLNKIVSILNENLIILPQDVDLNTLLYYSDMVIGFFSNILIEAHIMNKCVLRFLPENLTNDPIEFMKFGKLVTPNTIENEIKSYLQ